MAYASSALADCADRGAARDVRGVVRAALSEKKTGGAARGLGGCGDLCKLFGYIERI